MEGYNVTVLAYGQTSSGKSYTMGTDTSHATSSTHSSPSLSSNSPSMGSNSNSSGQQQDERAGIIPRAVKQIFEEINRRTRNESGRWKCETKTSYVEIYSESDLLSIAYMPRACQWSGCWLYWIYRCEMSRWRPYWSTCWRCQCEWRVRPASQRSIQCAELIQWPILLLLCETARWTYACHYSRR